MIATCCVERLSEYLDRNDFNALVGDKHLWSSEVVYPESGTMLSAYVVNYSELVIRPILTGKGNKLYKA